MRVGDVNQILVCGGVERLQGIHSITETVLSLTLDCVPVVSLTILAHSTALDIAKNMPRTKASESPRQLHLNRVDQTLAPVCDHNEPILHEEVVHVQVGLLSLHGPDVVVCVLDGHDG